MRPWPSGKALGFHPEIVGSNPTGCSLAREVQVEERSPGTGEVSGSTPDSGSVRLRRFQGRKNNDQRRDIRIERSG